MWIIIETICHLVHNLDDILICFVQNFNPSSLAETWTEWVLLKSNQTYLDTQCTLWSKIYHSQLLAFVWTIRLVNICNLKLNFYFAQSKLVALIGAIWICSIHRSSFWNIELFNQPVGNLVQGWIEIQSVNPTSLSNIILLHWLAAYAFAIKIDLHPDTSEDVSNHFE